MILLPANLIYYFAFTELYLQINLPDFMWCKFYAKYDAALPV